MAEINLSGGPIFVDVSSDQQYPLNDFNQALLAPQQKNIIIELQPLALPDDGPREHQEVPDQAIGIQEEISNVDVEDMTNKVTMETSDGTAACITIQKRRVRCPECQRYTAETEEKMLRHIRKVHRGENPFQCLMCDYSTYNKVLFEEHVRIHQGIKPYKCSQCPYRSVSKKNTKKHELIHRPNNPLKCMYCDFIARHPRALKCHVDSHDCIKEEPGTSLTCPSCPFQYKKQVQLRNHRKNVKRCKDCSYKACTRKILSAHMVSVHKKKKSIVVKKDVPNLFDCSLCEWGSTNKAKILLHLIHHPNQKVDESVINVSILREYGIMK